MNANNRRGNGHFQQEPHDVTMSQILFGHFFNPPVYPQRLGANQQYQQQRSLRHPQGSSRYNRGSFENQQRPPGNQNNRNQRNPQGPPGPVVGSPQIFQQGFPTNRPREQFDRSRDQMNGQMGYPDARPENLQHRPQMNPQQGHHHEDRDLQSDANTYNHPMPSQSSTNSTVQDRLISQPSEASNVETHQPKPNIESDLIENQIVDPNDAGSSERNRSVTLENVGTEDFATTDTENGLQHKSVNFVEEDDSQKSIGLVVTNDNEIEKKNAVEQDGQKSPKGNEMNETALRSTVGMTMSDSFPTKDLGKETEQQTAVSTDLPNVEKSSTNIDSIEPPIVLQIKLNLVLETQDTIMKNMKEDVTLSSITEEDNSQQPNELTLSNNPILENEDPTVEKETITSEVEENEQTDNRVGNMMNDIVPDSDRKEEEPKEPVSFDSCPSHEKNLTLSISTVAPESYSHSVIQKKTGIVFDQSTPINTSACSDISINNNEINTPSVTTVVPLISNVNENSVAPIVFEDGEAPCNPSSLPNNNKAEKYEKIPSETSGIQNARPVSLPSMDLGPLSASEIVDETMSSNLPSVEITTRDITSIDCTVTHQTNLKLILEPQTAENTNDESTAILRSSSVIPDIKSTLVISNSKSCTEDKATDGNSRRNGNDSETSLTEQKISGFSEVSAIKRTLVTQIESTPLMLPGEEENIVSETDSSRLLNESQLKGETKKNTSNVIIQQEVSEDEPKSKKKKAADSDGEHRDQRNVLAEHAFSSTSPECTKTQQEMIASAQPVSYRNVEASNENTSKKTSSPQFHPTKQEKYRDLIIDAQGQPPQGPVFPVSDPDSAPASDPMEVNVTFRNEEIVQRVMTCLPESNINFASLEQFYTSWLPPRAGWFNLYPDSGVLGPPRVTAQIVTTREPTPMTFAQGTMEAFEK